MPKVIVFVWAGYSAQTATMESELIVYAYVIDYLKFQATNFDVRKESQSV